MCLLIYMYELLRKRSGKKIEEFVSVVKIWCLFISLLICLALVLFLLVSKNELQNENMCFCTYLLICAYFSKGLILRGLAKGHLLVDMKMPLHLFVASMGLECMFVKISSLLYLYLAGLKWFNNSITLCSLEQLYCFGWKKCYCINKKSKSAVHYILTNEGFKIHQIVMYETITWFTY